MPSTLRWLLIHTSIPARISSRAISAWISEKPMTRSGRNARMSSILALVNAETFGFSRRACAGRTVKPEIPTIRSCKPSAYSTSVGSSVKQTIRSTAWHPRGKPLSLVPQHGHRHLALMRIVPMLIKINALPGAQLRATVVHRHGQADASENGAHVRRHIVRAFGVVLEDRVAVGHGARKPAFEIGAHGRVSVFADQQRAAGVRGKDVDDAGMHAAKADQLAHFVADLAE